MLCKKNVGMVHAAQKANAEKFEVVVRPAKDHKEEITGHGIASHGVVCVDGAGKKLWMHADHKLSQEDLDKGVKEVLGALE